MRPMRFTDRVRHNLARGLPLPLISGGDGSTAVVDDLEKSKRTAVEKARGIAAKAETEGRDFNDAERAEVKSLIEEAQATDAKIKGAKADKDLLDTVTQFEKGLVDLPGPTAQKGGTLGDRFLRDSGLNDYLKSIQANGKNIPEKVRVQSPPVHFNGIDDLFGRKDIITGTDLSSTPTPGTLVQTDWRGVLDDWQRILRPLSLRNIVSSGTTTSDTISYARILSVVNNAAPVAEASGTSAGDASGDITGIKPESEFALETVTDNVRTIAHWMPVTRRALSDAAQIRTLIDTFLRYGLEEELEDQMIDGNGTGENFEGLLNVSGTQAQPLVTDIAVTLRKAKTKARIQGRGRNISVVLNPEDSERIDLLRDTTGQYLGAGPFGVQGIRPIWGMPVVESEAIDAGTAIVGDFRWAVLYDREQAAVMLSDSHLDFFVRNLIAVLAELRAAFAIIRPAAFVITDVA